MSFTTCPIDPIHTACDRQDDTTPRLGEEPIVCGGFGGQTCPEGQVCVDAPNDGCDPDEGGADCIGICEPAPIKIKPGHPKHPKLGK